MDFEFEVQHCPGQNHITTDASSRLSASQIDESDIDDDIPAYEVDNVHAVTDSNVEAKVEPLTIQLFLSFPKRRYQLLSVSQARQCP